MDITQPEEGITLTDAELRKCMQNRELSWLQFNERVLEEADKPENPLFERFFFLSIFTSNLDEFYMIRVGGLCDHALHGTGVIDNKTGMGAEEQLRLIYEATKRLYAARDAVCHGLETELAKEGIERFQLFNAITEKKQQRILDAYYENHILPFLAPQIIDQSHPFPHLENNRQIIALLLENKNGKSVYGIIPVPSRVGKLDRSDDGDSNWKNEVILDRMYFPDENRYILIEDIILQASSKIFKRYKVVEKAIICVTRNADIVAEEERFDEDEDLRDHMSKLLKKRRRLSPVRLEVRGANCGKIVAYLQKKLSLTSAQTFFSLSPLDMTHYQTIRDKAPQQLRNKHIYQPFEPVTAQYASLYGDFLRRVNHGDVLLYHPYDAITPFLSLVREAAEDRQVLSIQITLYRIAERSKLVDYLIFAAENGKDVFVFIELRARMDEENNIGWAKRLEESGCNVFYGPPGFKLHAKICLITRREGVKTEYITQIGTGNYNEKTARLYTDISIITVNQAIGRDAALFFNSMKIGDHEDHTTYELFLVAPGGFKTRLIELIEKEAMRGLDGRITLKCNSLTDRDIIIALIKASCAGAKIDLIVRGICCLIAQIPGYTENIRVRSIVGRFLEHARIYRFGGLGADCVMYIGSGDMMTRNTERRVELFVPVLDAKNRARLSTILDIMLADNYKAREMNAEGSYVHVAPPDAGRGGAGNAGGAASGDGDAIEGIEIENGGGIEDSAGNIVDSQMYFIQEASENAAKENTDKYTKHNPAGDIIKKILFRFRFLQRKNAY